MKASAAFPAWSSIPNRDAYRTHFFRFGVETPEDAMLAMDRDFPVRLPFEGDFHWAEGGISEGTIGVEFYELTWENLKAAHPDLSVPQQVDWAGDISPHDPALVLNMYWTGQDSWFVQTTALLDRGTRYLRRNLKGEACLFHRTPSHFPGVSSPFGRSPELRDAQREVGYQALRHVLHNLALINCKNVELETHRTTSKPSKKSRRPRPEIEYHTIKLPAPSGGGGGSKTQNPGSGRHHLVRGHFKTYTEEHKLFGRHTGTYWWPWTARGSKENGEVVSTYDVTPRKEA